MEKTNFTQMMRWVKGTVLAVVAMLGLGLNQAGAQTACYDDFTVPLGDSCMATLSPAMVGISSGNGYSILVSASDLPGEICSSSPNFEQMDTLTTSPYHSVDTIYGEGNWMYGAYLFDEENGCWQLFCWGTFTTEDKIDPRFYGDTVNTDDISSTRPDESMFNQYGTYKEVSYLTWDAGGDDGDDGFDYQNLTFLPGNWSCFQSTNHPDLTYSFPHDEEHYYDTLTITPKASGVLTIIANSIRNNGNRSDNDYIDVTLAVYGEDGFDEDNPCNNIIALGESSFLPNPLAGLGFANALNNTSAEISAVPDTGNIFAPWLLHQGPVARMAVKVSAGEPLTVLITSRDPLDEDGHYTEVFFMLDAYTNNNLTSDKLTDTPFTNYDTDSLHYDTAFAFFDFICADIDEVMLDNQANLNQGSYLGGSYGELAAWYNSMACSGSLSAAGGNNDVTYQEMLALGSAWRKYAAQLLGLSLAGSDTILVDLNVNDLLRDFRVEPLANKVTFFI